MVKFDDSLEKQSCQILAITANAAATFISRASWHGMCGAAQYTNGTGDGHK